MSSAWAESAAAWIADIGDEGDYGRACVLDRPMIPRSWARFRGRVRRGMRRRPLLPHVASRTDCHRRN
jgi:hypothetical protein